MNEAILSTRAISHALVIIAAVLVIAAAPATSAASGGGQAEAGRVVPLDGVQKIDARLAAFLAEIAPEAEVHVWVFFTDKGIPSAERASQLAVAHLALPERVRWRRAKVRGTSLVDERDLPVNPAYIRGVAELGVTHRATSRWLNAVSVAVPAQRITDLAALPYVSEVRRVASFRRTPVDQGVPHVSSPITSSGGRSFDYGRSEDQVALIDVPAVHDCGLSGAGVIVCMLDSGYDYDHESLDHLDIIAEHDFINDDDVTHDESGDPWGQDEHGTYTLSALAGFHPGRLIGPAYGASFLLAKTEDTAHERPIEEDWWVEGIEWAEANGADVASSSLGYMDWYSYSDMDGDTAVTTIAADIAVENGVVVCNAMGNEGQTYGAIIAPADGHNVISVGAVYSDGYLTDFSSSGPTYDDRTKPEVCAQGSSVYSATTSGTSSYTWVSGTSLSTPLVAGTVALLIEAHPEWTPFDVRDALMSTADHWWEPDDWYGWGVVSALQAVGPPCYVCGDADGDLFDDDACGGTDCDDADTEVNPSVEEVSGDGIDNDCDGRVDEVCFIGAVL